MASIDWKKFEANTKFVKFDNETTKRLVLSNWRESSTKFGEQPERPSLVFDVLSEDGTPCEKTLEVSNHTFVMGMRPIIEKAEQRGAAFVKVAAKKSGSGKGTIYLVMEEL